MREIDDLILKIHRDFYIKDSLDTYVSKTYFFSYNNILNYKITNYPLNDSTLYFVIFYQGDFIGLMDLPCIVMNYIISNNDFKIRKVAATLFFSYKDYLYNFGCAKVNLDVSNNESIRNFLYNPDFSFILKLFSKKYINLLI